MFLRLLITVLLPISVLLISYKSVLYYNNQENYTYEWNTTVENTSDVSNESYLIDKKHRGITVFGWRNATNEKAINELLKTNTEWVALVPFLYQENEETTVINTRDDYQQWSARDSVFIKVIRQLQEKKIKTHLKPHLWMSDGWRSNIKQSSKLAWDTWFDSYEINMLHYARLAAMMKVDLFCIGTELKTSILNQPERWNKLIHKIKEIYKGELTYAANWDGEQDVFPFWNEMDYIGIQGYFPLTTYENATVEQIKVGWKPHIEKLKTISNVVHKPILFTEIGYRSASNATIKPWEWNDFSDSMFDAISTKTQSNAYQAIFEVLWNEKWFAGMYIWEWDIRTTKESTYQRLNFSPRFKPAENIITIGYRKKSNKN